MVLAQTAYFNKNLDLLQRRPWRKAWAAVYSAVMFLVRSSSRFFGPLLLAVSLALGVGASAQQLPLRIHPDSGPWDSGAGFQFDLSKKKIQKTRQSVSGMACTIDARQRRICLIAFDEGGQARYAYVGDKTLVPDVEPVVLRNTDEELDVEGAATDGQYFYITGSHSAKRGDCASNPGSRHVLRFKLDPATGRALQSPTSGGSLVNYADSGRLWQIMQAQTGLAAHVGEHKCLGSEPPDKAPALSGQQGANIEGLAVQAGRLYFGFRGPASNGVAQVLAVDADALFSADVARDPRTTLTRLALGPNRGIRDMIAVKSGFLLLAGPDDSPTSKNAGWIVASWDGQRAPDQIVQPKVLAALDLSRVKLRACDEELKPEAMTVLEETPAAYKLLVLSDGMCDGGPLVFTVAR